MNKIFLFIVVCLVGIGVNAQPINIGIHGGVSSTKIKVKNIEQIRKTSLHTGYTLGVFARVNLGPLYVEPSLDYSHKQGEVQTRDNDKGTLKYNSFDIPIMLGLHVIDIEIVKVRAFLGPVASFTGKLKTDGFHMPDIIDNRKAMWNGKFGVGVDLWKFTLDLDYEKGFRKFQKHYFRAPNSLNFTVGFKLI
ncbi:MAG: PorT family protein [Odoribacter sp.]|nr:PorT family protein [Odoribacter sp.]